MLVIYAKFLGATLCSKDDFYIFRFLTIPYSRIQASYFLTLGIPCNSPGLPPHERADQLPEGPEDEEGHGGEGPDLPGLPGHAEHTQA